MQYPGMSSLKILTLLSLPFVLAGCPKAPASIPAASGPRAPLSSGAPGTPTPGAGTAEPRGGGQGPSAVAPSTAAPGASDRSATANG